MNPFANALVQLDNANQILKLKLETLEALKKPNKILEAKIPVKMDSGKTKKFDAYRIQYNNARGPYKGGIRFHEQVDINEVKALSFWMAIKCAVVNIPMGGGKGGVMVNPKELSTSELEQLARGYARAFVDDIGPNKDVPAPDVNTNPLIMDWMADEYSKLTGDKTQGSFTGKSLESGGSEGRNTATADGGFFIFQELAKILKLKPSETDVIIQGLGNVGFHTARLMAEAKYKIIGLSDSQGTIVSNRKAPLDPIKVMEVKRESGLINACYYDGSVKGYDCKHLDPAEFLEYPCDVLVPAALENQITKDNAANIKAKIILEMANGPTTPEADKILAEHDTLILPDVLANAGGVTVSYFEWYQNVHDEKWTEDQVRKKLKPIMTKAFKEVWKVSQKHKIDMRTAAFVVAVRRIADAMEKNK